MEIKTSQEEKDEFSRQFDKLKELARNKEDLPQGMKFDKVDCAFYETMFNLFASYRLGAISGEKATEKGRNYRNLYIAEKRQEKLVFDIRKKLLEKQKTFPGIMSKLIKNEYGAVETFNKIFELIALLSDDEVSANLIRRNAGFSIVTGMRLTEEEQKELEKQYGADFRGSGRLKAN